MPLFGKKTVHFCAICSKELKHKYKPPSGSEVEGYLCSDCHIEKTKEAVLKQQEEKARLQEAPDTCAICKKELVQDTDLQNKPRWQWNLEAGSLLCKSCFDTMEAKYQKELNYCVICNRKIGFIRYNPKPAWNLKGQMCRECWDKQNAITKGKV